MAEREDDRRAMVSNYYKQCPECGRRMHISKRFRVGQSWSCVGCGFTSAIGTWPDVSAAEARQVGKIIDLTPKPEGPKKLGGLQG